MPQLTSGGDAAHGFRFAVPPNGLLCCGDARGFRDNLTGGGILLPADEVASSSRRNLATKTSPWSHVRCAFSTSPRLRAFLLDSSSIFLFVHHILGLFLSIK